MTNRVCQILGIKKPIVQAVMHSVTDYHSIAAVCNTGAMGSFGFNPGYT